jgi:phosphate:Na+ symporter
MILKVVRIIRFLKDTEDPVKYLKKLAKLRDKADKSDVIIDGSIDKLVRKNLITNDMATSLMNDSAAAKSMVHNLISIAELLYIQRDMLLDQEPLDMLALEQEEGILTLDD